eukprot:478397_1
MGTCALFYQHLNIPQTNTLEPINNATTNIQIPVSNDNINESKLLINNENKLHSRLNNNNNINTIRKQRKRFNSRLSNYNNNKDDDIPQNESETSVDESETSDADSTACIKRKCKICNKLFTKYSHLKLTELEFSKINHPLCDECFAAYGFICSHCNDIDEFRHAGIDIRKISFYHDFPCRNCINKGKKLTYACHVKNCNIHKICICEHEHVKKKKKRKHKKTKKPKKQKIKKLKKIKKSANDIETTVQKQINNNTVQKQKRINSLPKPQTKPHYQNHKQNH